MKSSALKNVLIMLAILLVVTMITCGLTTKVKKQEMIKAENLKEGGCAFRFALDMEEDNDA